MCKKSTKIIVYSVLMALLNIFLVQSVPAAAKKSSKPVAQKTAKKATVQKKQGSVVKKAKVAQVKPKGNAKKPVAVAKASRKTSRTKAPKAVRTRKKTQVLVDADPWQETENLVVQSNTALVVDQRGGDTLYQKNARQTVPIASITKLMTAMVVLDANLQMSQRVTIDDADVDYVRRSRSRLPVGAAMTRETALLLALMSSENRAANALSRHYPGGRQAFIHAMNAKAKSLGMTRTRFEDATGLSSNNVSSAVDLAKMVQAAHQYPLIREFSTVPEAIVDIGGNELAYHNTNPLVKSSSWNVGLSKTGFIHEAGKCLVMQARVANRPVVIVLLDANGGQARVKDANRIKRWMEHTYVQTVDGKKIS